MPVGDSKYRFRQLDAAEHQLDHAIQHFVDLQDFVCAITLASAADGIFGETIRGEKRKSSIDDHVTNLSPQAPGLSEKEIRDKHLNLARNLLKHVKVPPHQEIELSLETEAIYMITRALDNAVRLGYSLSGHRQIFVDWVYANRTDLIGD